MKGRKDKGEEGDVEEFRRLGRRGESEERRERE